MRKNKLNIGSDLSDRDFELVLYNVLKSQGYLFPKNGRDASEVSSTIESETRLPAKYETPDFILAKFSNVGLNEYPEMISMAAYASDNANLLPTLDNLEQLKPTKRKKGK